MANMGGEELVLDGRAGEDDGALVQAREGAHRRRSPGRKRERERTWGEGESEGGETRSCSHLEEACDHSV